MPKPVRPQPVTSACLFVGISCSLLLYYVVTALTSWNTLDVQDGLRGVLDDVDLGALGLSTEGAIDALRTALLIAVVPLVAGVVLAVYAARGHRPSRVPLTVIAVLSALVFVMTGGLLGLLPAAFAVAAVVQLWSRDARTWFDVVNGREPSIAATARTPPDPFAERSSTPPTPSSGTVAAVPPATSPPQAAVVSGPPRDPDRMPAAVRTIVLITSIATGLAVAASAMYLLVYLVARDAVVAAQLESPFRSVVDSTDDEIIDAMRVSAVICGITVVLGIAALGAMVLLIRRRGLGHLALTVLSGVTTIVGVFTVVGLPWAGAAVWVLVLLRRRETRAWVGST